MCLKCNESIPISVLRSHVKECTGGSPDSTADDGVSNIAEPPNDGSIASASDNFKHEEVQHWCYMS